MSSTLTQRRVPDDWYDGCLPDNVEVAPDALIETAFSFTRFRSTLPQACAIGSGTSVYLGTMLDVGARGRVQIGRYVILNGPRIVCDSAVTIGDYALIAWGVILMDSYRVPLEIAARRTVLRAAACCGARDTVDAGAGRPIHIGATVWIGFDTCVLPGVTIGEGTVVGARSVVGADIPAYCIAAGNPARIIRHLPEGASHA